MRQNDFTEAEWNILQFECEDCGFQEYSPNGDEGECPECEGYIIPEWNYEGMDCMNCKKYIEIEEDIHSKDDGDFEDILCQECFDNLPSE